MLKLIVTDAGVSKGYKDNPALRFSEGEGSAIVRFRIGKKVYDSRCEGNNRWINLNVKAFGDVCERIRRMKLKEGSFVNIIGRYDEESWTDKNTDELRTAPVLIVDEVEYCFSGNGQKEEKSQNSEYYFLITFAFPLSVDLLECQTFKSCWEHKAELMVFY